MYIFVVKISFFRLDSTKRYLAHMFSRSLIYTYTLTLRIVHPKSVYRIVIVGEAIYCDLRIPIMANLSFIDRKTCHHKFIICKFSLSDVNALLTKKNIAYSFVVIYEEESVENITRKIFLKSVLRNQHFYICLSICSHVKINLETTKKK